MNGPLTRAWFKRHLALIVAALVLLGLAGVVVAIWKWAL